MNKVSIIVPNYNHEKYLQQRLDSIFNQTYQDFEVILLDDCSTDSSRVILEKYRNHPKVSHIIYNKENSGTSYKQWYKGIEYAKGELIWIAESDDWCDKRFLEILVPHFNDRMVSLVFTKTKFIIDNNTFIKPVEITGLYKKIDGNNFIKEYMLSGNKIPNASMVIFRKDNYNKVKDKGYKDLKLAGDWLLWINLINNYTLVSVTDKLNFCRKHSQNTTNILRKKGLDLIEGLIVMNIGKNFCKNKFNRKKTYLKRWDYYNQYKKQFDFGINNIVLFNILKKEPFMFFFFINKIIRKKIKSIISYINVTCLKFQ